MFVHRQFVAERFLAASGVILIQDTHPLRKIDPLANSLDLKVAHLEEGADFCNSIGPLRQ